MLKKVLVTGGKRFIGNHLCERLLNKGSEVMCVDNFFTGTKDNVVHLLKNLYFEVLRHDITSFLYVEVDLIFNRPGTTQQVFNEIQKAKPAKLFVAADGPRDNELGDSEKCQRAREIINQVDWDCEVKTLFRDKNLGCKIAVSSAINWFFKNTEEGIILEDDCLPSQSFFWFCQPTFAGN